MKYIGIFYLFCSPFYVVGQNNPEISFFIGQGNSFWKYSKLQIADVTPLGDTLNIYDIDIHANCPTIIGSLTAGYNFNSLSFGIGFSAQHYFVNEFITEAIHLPGAGFSIPTTFAPFNDPQPTHFKLYPYISFILLKETNIEISGSISGGTFLTHSMTVDSLEGFHWFANFSCGVNYYFRDMLALTLAPAYDYSRVNLNLFTDPAKTDPFFNVSSIYLNVGMKFLFI